MEVTLPAHEDEYKHEHEPMRWRSLAIQFRRTIALGSTLAVLWLLILRLHLSTRQYHLSLEHESASGIEAPQVEWSNGHFPLRPHYHSFRRPTIIREKWRVTSGERRPDGVLKRVYLINDAFPGPTLEALSGDRIIVEVENALENDEGLAIHWHGLSMRGANAFDGASGVTQNPIAAGEAFTYDFTVDTEQSGTFFYHAHDGVQRADGLYGGLVIHKPRASAEQSNVADEHLLMIGDWYHRSALQALDFYMHPGSFGNEPVPDSILLNGASVYNCSNAVPARPLDCERRTASNLPALRLDVRKKTVLRIVNVGAYAALDVQVSGAILTPIAVDGGNPIEGKSAYSVGVLQPGERVDLLVQRLAGEKASDAGLLNVKLDTLPFKYPNSALTSEHAFPVAWHGVAASNGPEVTEPLERFALESARSASGQSKIKSGSVDQTVVLYAITQKLTRLNNVPHGSINNTYWEPQASPPMPLISLDREQWDEHQLVPYIPFVPDLPLWVDIVLNNLDEEGHPFHLHGMDFWVLSTYSSTYNWGSYNPFEDASPPGGPFNFADALKKDTVLVPRRGYAVLRVRADNPGIWMFHCHVLWHQASGMAMALQIGS